MTARYLEVTCGGRADGRRSFDFRRNQSWTRRKRAQLTTTLNPLNSAITRPGPARPGRKRREVAALERRAVSNVEEYRGVCRVRREISLHWREPDTSATRHFSTTKLVPKCPNHGPNTSAPNHLDTSVPSVSRITGGAVPRRNCPAAEGSLLFIDPVQKWRKEREREWEREKGRGVQRHPRRRKMRHRNSLGDKNKEVGVGTKFKIGNLILNKK